MRFRGRRPSRARRGVPHHRRGARSVLAAAAVCLAGGALPTSAAGQETVVGDTLLLGEGLEVAGFPWRLFSFDSDGEAESIEVRVESPDFRPLAAVIPPEGYLVLGVSADQPPGESRVALDDRPGRWAIVVTSFGPFEEGRYTLTVRGSEGMREVGEAEAPEILDVIHVEALFLRGEPPAMANGDDFEPFPWPPPAPSARTVLDADRLPGDPAERTLGWVAGILEAAVEAVPYPDYRYLAAPNGFALVCAPEQIDEEGEPEPPPARWEAVRAVPESVLDWIRGIFAGNPGRFRVIVFVVTDEPLETEPVEVSREMARAWLDAGSTRLPTEVAERPLTEAYDIHALIYEFLQEELDGQPVIVIPGAVAARAHLTAAGLMDRLER